MKLNLTNLYEKYSAMVYRRCLFLLKNEDEAFDTMQDVFIRVFQNKNPMWTSFFF